MGHSDALSTSQALEVSVAISYYLDTHTLSASRLCICAWIHTYISAGTLQRHYPSFPKYRPTHQGSRNVGSAARSHGANVDVIKVLDVRYVHQGDHGYVMIAVYSKGSSFQSVLRHICMLESG